MVFKPFTHLARQSFVKTFTHGYAQSVVAATQSSYASSTTPFGPFGNHSANRHGKHGTTQLHTAFQNTPSSSGASNKASHGDQNATGSGDEGLAAYYEAWQNQQQHEGENKEWKQFQFPKRIGWKAPSVVPDGKAREREDVGLRAEVQVEREGLDRAYSASAVDEIKQVEDEAAEAIAVAKVDEAIAKEISNTHQVSAPVPREAAGTTVSSDVQVESAKQTSINSDKSVSPTSLLSSTTANTSALSTPSSGVITVSSTQDAQSQAFCEHIGKLNAAQRYAEIPPVFESMLVKGLRPTTEAYNALLAAAIHLPVAKHHVVPKALGVYSDMLRRKVLPDTVFYATLIELLASRALEVFVMRDAVEKKRLRFGGLKESGKFLFSSNEAELAILAEDDALSTAVKIFNSSVSTQKTRRYSSETYRLLITACALHRRVDDMIRTYSHMEARKVIPIATMFPPMIDAFAVAGELASAVECYNEYKSLAIADDAGKLAIIQRKDNEVYASLVKAYTTCGKADGGNRFLGRIVESYDGVTEHRMERLGNMQDIVLVNALVQARLDAGDLHHALTTAEEGNLTSSARSEAMARVCTTAADHGNFELATKAYQYIHASTAGASTAAISMLALHIRQGKVELARNYWSIVAASSEIHETMIEPTTMYAVSLIGSGHVDEGLMEARQVFARVRASSKATIPHSEITEEIDEGIEIIGRFLADKGIVPSPNASMSFLWAMIENGGLVSPVAEQMLAGLGAETISGLSWQDLTLALQVEAEMLSTGNTTSDIAHTARFANLLETAVSNGVTTDKRTSDLVERALAKISHQRPDLIERWQSYRHLSVKAAYVPQPFTPAPSLPAAMPSTYADTFDPYAATTDYRGSTIIIEELENHRAKTGAGLNEALMRFRNIRRAGRHPRYIVYAKLISAAAREGRANLVHDIHGMARQDVPFFAQYAVVRHGWSSILDAMVGACLTVGNRTLAARFHQELLDMGSAPTANTFGLYITTLKDSTKTFDEATEAVRIFQRAKSEEVEPSSFLYNALIGKLGKARRIDDCLFYFAEMRNLGIRPTSVTYGTIVNALCRVSDERFAEELFDEMESMPNYKPRPAPYNSLMQFFLTTKRDSSKVLAYYERMLVRSIQPTMHTYKLLIDTYATLDPINLTAAEGVLDTIRASGQRPEAVHYASLIHAKGCALHDMAGARQIFNEVIANPEIRPQACLYQALFESMVANHFVAETEELLDHMSARQVAMTPYIANTLIHGWATEKNITKSKAVYESVGLEKREPSTYEAMTRAFLTVEGRDNAMGVVHEMLSRGYPSAVSGKILELLGPGMSRGSSVAPSGAMA